MISLTTILIGVSFSLIVSILSSKASARFGIPALLIFLIIGMIAGSEGVGHIAFNNPRIAQYIGIVALIFILFSGGLETQWESVRPVLREGIALSTIGVLTTAAFLGGFVVLVCKFTVKEGLLLGAIVSSTDAAAVFSVLRSRKVSLAAKLKPLLEFESGSNDPMGVFLTIGFLTLVTNPLARLSGMIPLFFLQMGVGALAGYLAGKGIVWVINNLKLEYDGLYPVLTMSLVLLTYAVTGVLQGSGFLAVYIVGLMMGNNNFIQKRNLIHYHGGLAWLMQIVMFLVLGLLVFPSRLIPIAGPGLLMALFLICVARPIGVFVSLARSAFTVRQKLFVSWVGLRGSVPIVLATFPLLAGIVHAELMFNIIFFIVLASTLVQGTSISLAIRVLGVGMPYSEKRTYPIEFQQTDDLNTRMLDYAVPFGSCMIGKMIFELELPSDSLITMIVRNENFIIPSGKTVIEEGDILLILVNNNNLVEVQQICSTCKIETNASSEVQV
ncbi:MAG: potassium/proton antiporter [Endomicrobiales bacterium]|jgi:cell volume regulation protein A